MSAVSQDAIAVSQGDRVVYEIDQAWPPTGSGGAGSCGGFCSLADVIGLVAAYVVALALAPPAPRRTG